LIEVNRSGWRRTTAGGKAKGTRSRLQSADPSVWISPGRIAAGPFEVGAI